ncbi:MULTISPECIES: trypco2 family protein [Streptomyces]|uniref:Trypsin-co-occurring domain-containing protein n=1 Tax=Streptomyces asoensis TaxID=249586 RepID=A0A6M4WSJ9_9ACTN|nr:MULTISPECIES: trypco2 family protein [Streptomyces]QJS99282.1 hypothetical protein G9272_02325 [Streptomyces asoensis]WSN37716.1 hypothetical protein OG736_02655 [Streptomyces sp. NBC_01334]
MEWDGAELSEAISAVRAGLAQAQQDGDGLPFRFTVKDVVLDLAVEIRRTTSAGGGVKAFVVSADARGERAHTASHRMTITLAVAPSDGNDLLIGSRGTDRGGQIEEAE